MTRGDSMESWEVNAVKAVKDLPFAEIVMEIRDGSSLSAFDGVHAERSRSAQSDNVTNKIRKYKWNRLFWNRWFRKYGKVDATRKFDHFGDNPPPEIFHAVPCHTMIPELKGKHSQHFSEKDLEIIRWHKPDVILRFGFNILRGEILTVAKHGVWSYHHADHETIRGGPAGFWEYILGHNITGAILQRLTDKLDDGIVLRKGYWSLTKHSFRENLDNLLNYSSGWMANALTEIHHHGKVKPQNAEKKTSSKVYSYPGNLRMIQFWFILLGNKIGFHWKNLFCPETWTVGMVNQPISDVIENGIQKEVKWVSPLSRSEYYADPFPIMVLGGFFMAAEHYSYKTQKGEIRFISDKEEIILRKPDQHLSFPFPFSSDGKEYILPEFAESGKASLFEVSSKNKTEIILVNEPLVDTVMLQHNNKWWLFANKADHQNNAALFAYYADKFDGQYKPHALNPVKTDIRNSRSAGAILNINGKLLRPAQDSSRTYGCAIVINEITDLTPTSFSEREVKRIEPNPDWDYNKGIHTISEYGNKTLIDAKSFRFNFANFKAQLKRKTGRIAGK